MEKQNSLSFWTIPNLLSLYRIVVFPFIMWLIFSGYQHLFSIFIAISLITDILDGFIARRFHMQTKIGAMLDSWADLGTYILAFLAIYIFKWDVIRPHALAFYIFIFIMVLSYILVFVKFHKLIGLHTYLFKITGYLQGGFIFILFVFGFYPSLYYIAIICGTLACLEEIVIIMILRYPQTNVKGLYWVLKRSLL